MVEVFLVIHNFVFMSIEKVCYYLCEWGQNFSVALFTYGEGKNN